MSLNACPPLQIFVHFFAVCSVLKIKANQWFRTFCFLGIEEAIVLFGFGIKHEVFLERSKQVFLHHVRITIKFT